MEKPVITLALGIVAIFLENPKENHMMEVKRILRYLKGTDNYGLCYKRSDRFEEKIEK